MSNIKINDVPQRIQYAATGGQTQFTVPFPFFQNNFIYVWLNGVQLFMGGAPGQYTVTGAGSPSGGLVTFNTATTLNDIVTIEGIMPIDRTSIYSATISNLTGSDLNGDFNREVVMLQQLNTVQSFMQLQYAPWAQVSQDLTVTKDRYIPLLAAQQVWRMNEAGDAIEAYTIDNVPAPSNSYFLTYGTDASLENEQNLALLGNGILKQTVSGGLATLALAVPGVDYLDPSSPLGTMAYQDASNVNITGGFAALGAGSVATSPTSATDLVNKAYADSISAGFTFKSACYATSTANLSATYANGASGVGATLTATGNGALSLDGTSPIATSRVCITDQTNTFENGIYTVTDAGSAGTPFILTRATDFDSSSEIVPGAITFIQEGTLFGDTSFVQTEIVTTVGTSPVLFVQFSQTYPLSLGNGGTGVSLSAVNNAVFITNGLGVSLLSTTLPSGLTIPGYATSGANANITSLTGLTGKIQAPTAIASSAGLNVLGFTYTASAVNNLEVINNVTTANPEIAASGTDTNIGITYRTKATGAHQFISSNTTVPMVWKSGTSAQHTTNWSIPNTAASRTITLQDLDGTMAYLADRGMVLLQSQTVSSPVASVVFTNMTGYTNYLVLFSNYTPATNATGLNMQMSINNGSSFISAAASYRSQNFITFGASTAAATSTGTFLSLSSNHNNTAGTACAGSIFINNPGGGFFTTVNYNSFYITGAVSTANYLTGGQCVGTTSAVNAFAIFPSSGNISSGNFQLYGIR